MNTNTIEFNNAAQQVREQLEIAAQAIRTACNIANNAGANDLVDMGEDVIKPITDVLDEFGY